MGVSKKTLILGDMLELGEQSSTEHQNIINLLQQNDFDNVLLVGQRFMETKNSYRCFTDFNDLNIYLKRNPLTNHYILIKGSRGIKLENVITSL
jgi:UDP-N-acetylmuramoyl-tripeptide--D-alanyl-D-alanine ligase